MNTIKRAAVSAALAAVSLTATATWAAEPPAHKGHISLVPSELKWVDAPSIGPGAKLAMIEGDLKAAGPITFRVKVPAKFKVGVHTHPIIEHVTVISGAFYLGIGEKFDASQAREYSTGAVTIMPPGMPMYAFTKSKGAIIQVHGVGPWGINYLDPADDPRKKQ